MINNENSFESTTHAFDICIIGAGPAGISLACSLAKSGSRIALLESGGLKLQPGIQLLAGGDSTGQRYFRLDESRYRVFGGSTFRWGARGAPFREIDFRKREWVDRSGWPIPYEDMSDYYARAEELIGMNVGFEYGENVWENFTEQTPAYDSDTFDYQAFQFGKNVMFGDRYREELTQAPNIQVYLESTLTGFELDLNGRISHGIIKTRQNKPIRLQANLFVLACGGIENARMLLASRKHSKSGLANSSDLVGRCFMEHPTVPAGIVVPTVNAQQLLNEYSPGRAKGRLVETGLAISPKVQEAEQCLNGYARIKPALAPDATQALREILWDLKHHRLGKNQGSRVSQVLRDPIGIAQNAYRHLANKPKQYRMNGLYVEVRSEQAPHAHNRLTLSNQTDALGVPKAQLHWELDQQDKHTMRVIASRIGTELARTGAGEFLMDKWLMSQDLSFPEELVGGHHHMGTTRMADSPSDGVVDTNCRTHDIDNLYIAGSSVFPTSGFTNPTLTLLALTLRLGDHLASKL